WSRGNGWVMGGLVRVLQVLPADHPARGRFVAQFREMAEKIRAIQLDNGFWSPSLLNPGDFAKRETSGTGFFCYALAWGVNQGLLERERFEPAARRAWAGLADCVDPDGKLTHVQPIGDSPYTFDETKTEAYGVGAFLLAGSEIYRMQLAAECPQATVEVRSVLDQLRPRETIEVDWAVVVKELSGASPATVAVMDGVAARWIPSQVTEAGGRPEALLFQADFLPGQTRSFSFILVKKRVEPTPTFTTYGRFVPERLDDFAWENDRIAFRIYGPALEASDSPDFLSSSGIDVWAKRTRVPVIDRWYKAGTYHEDHGEGLDNYKVGPSRGCGGLGVWDGKMLVCSKKVCFWKVLANGPVRTTFELTYAPWDTPTGKVSEVKRVSLDAGANLNRIESVLATESPLTVGVGLAENRGTGKVVKDEKSGLLCYWEDPDPNGNGSIGTAILADPRQVEGFAREAGPQLKGMAQNVMLLEATPRGGKATLTYYAGAGWDKSDDFADAVAWEAYLRHFAARLAHPLKVEAK
ncbi:MAG: DUF4861 family protein, partial [bacterium]|nr:DUF4861 family protein [bacterium]